MVDKAHVKRVAKVRALPVHRAMVLLHHAAMAHKVLRALKARAMAAVKVGAMVAVKVGAVKNNVAIPVLTTEAMAKVVLRRVVPVLRAVAQVVVHKGAKGGKTVVATTATSCRATLTH